MFKKIAFIGLGLIGGSLAKKIRQVFPQTVISAIANSQATVEYALEHKIIDQAGADLAETVRNAELIFVATPIDKISAAVKQAFAASNTQAIIVDVGSTKQKLCAALKKYRSKYIGGHPMAGTEKTGIQNSAAAILENALFALTPYSDTPEAKLTRLTVFLWELGLRTLNVSPTEHDTAVAAISHVPYFTAAALLQLADTSAKKNMTSTGFKSSTRVGESDPAWGLDIAKTNKTEVLKQLGRLQKELKTLQQLIRSGKAAPLKKYLEKSRELRKEIYP